ncbi:hypothetical protein [Spongiivirga citrea]|uniref:Uncharacterized protein n=1 Tax=Spongiivirga citrea TaxID=1481457 RepID=A0A6M0CJW7_9FLAO|nr:hypothetical protein [Spongiivirga citrea]NER16219.1 hypothetical protein [Spongiivirga citrea]
MKNVKLLCYLILGVLFYTSCTEQVDFEQAKDLSIQPVLTASLVTFSASPLQYAQPGVIQNASVIDTVRLDVIGEDFYKDNVIRTELTFNIVNNIEADFNLNFRFTDDEFADQYEFDIPIPEGSLANPAIVDYTEVFEGADLDRFTSSKIIILTATIINSSGTQFDATTTSEFNLKSKATAFFDFDL